MLEAKLGLASGVHVFGRLAELGIPCVLICRTLLSQRNLKAFLVALCEAHFI